MNNAPQQSNNTFSNLPKVYFSIIFAGAISYILIVLAEKTPGNLELQWLFTSCVVLLIAFIMISFTFSISLKYDSLTFLKMIFIASVTLIIFSFARFLPRYFERENLYSLEFSWYMLLCLIFASSSFLILYGFHKKEQDEKKYYYFLGGIIWIIIGIFYFLTNRILYGV